MRPRIVLSTLLGAAAFLGGCTTDDDALPNLDAQRDALLYPVDYPFYLGDPIPSPADNPTTQAAVALGRKLFFDKRLSSDNSIACASCHLPELAFADTTQFSRGVGSERASRNTPSLLNVSYNFQLNWDGGVEGLDPQGFKALEQQAFIPIQAHNEMNMTFPELILRLSADPEYVELFSRAYNSVPTNNTIVMALAAFQRTLLQANSKYDRYLQTNNPAVFTESEWRGYRLFNSEKFECFHCHPEPHFTDRLPHNNGLYPVYPDKGLYEITGNVTDRGKFKTPSLRNVAVTAPYMHDGSKPTLESVLDHYVSGGQDHPNQDPFFIIRIQASPEEKQDIVNFLHTLTDSVNTVH